MTALNRVRKPRCVLLYALAPKNMPAAEANRIFNLMIGDHRLPMPIFHDHFIGEPGGTAVFYVETQAEREALGNPELLQDWHVELRPLVFAFSPSAFDEQIAFTLRAYRGADWEKLRTATRPAYGSPAREAETAKEDLE